ncbi:MAG: electron transport complex subunit RsxA [Candidatus Krumholzibacteriota bacterium]|nr:electron transport complex subunit RsxA [Candidatus Krumholzibacteriota bacterium]
MPKLLLIIISAVLVNNFVLQRFLGICPFLGVSKRVSTALGMSGAVLFVMTMASVSTWLIYHYILVPADSAGHFVLIAADLTFLKTVTFILVIASLVQLVELVLQKLSPTLYQALGIFLPLITTNCAVLGVAVLNIQKEYSLLETTIFGIGAALGFGLAMILFSGLRERIDLCDTPVSFRGTAIGLVTAGLLSLAFMGFTGLVKI